MKSIPAIVLFLGACVAHADTNSYAVESGIYRVEVPEPGSNRIGLGAGVLIAPDKILTNCHVVKGRSGWPRVVNRVTSEKFAVTRYYNLGSFDACVLVGNFGGTPVSLATGFQEGDSVWIYGYPAGLPVVGQGSIKGLVDTDKGKSLLLAAFCAPGSSGGPVLNNKGQLVGLNWGVFRYQNQCLAIPADFLQPYIAGG